MRKRSLSEEYCLARGGIHIPLADEHKINPGDSTNWIVGSRPKACIPAIQSNQAVSDGELIEQGPISVLGPQDTTVAVGEDIGARGGVPGGEAAIEVTGQNQTMPCGQGVQFSVKRSTKGGTSFQVTTSMANMLIAGKNVQVPRRQM